MRWRHFEALAPVCPVCRVTRSEESPLQVSRTVKDEPHGLVEGVLQCTHEACLHEYPVLDGIPVILAGLRPYLEANLSLVCGRRDLSDTLESLLGDAVGPASTYNSNRQHLSSYAWDHYGDLDPEEETHEPGSVVRLLDRSLAEVGALPPGPVLDVGCAVGRSTFELAQRLRRVVVGVDLNFSMLRLATQVQRLGEVSYPRRQVGLVYHRRQFPVSFERLEDVDFWACDATALPFPRGSFALIAGLNVLDCVSSPYDALTTLAGSLLPKGKVFLTTPFDWSANATAIEAWLGGHSQRGPHGGSSEALLRALLTPGAHPSAVAGLELVAEQSDLEWQVRMHERSSVRYRVYLAVAQRRAETPGDAPTSPPDEGKPESEGS